MAVFTALMARYFVVSVRSILFLLVISELGCFTLGPSVLFCKLCRIVHLCVEFRLFF